MLVFQYQTSLSSFPLGLGQQLLYTLQRVLQDVHLEQQSLSLDLQPTQLLHHLVVAGLQLQLHRKHRNRSVWATAQEHMPVSGRPSVVEQALRGSYQWEPHRETRHGKKYLSLQRSIIRPNRTLNRNHPHHNNNRKYSPFLGVP